MIDNKDTIAAIATPAGNSGIGIIRISGQDALKTADKIIRSRQGKSLDLFSAGPNTAHYGFVFDNDDCIDEVICTIYRTPRSYTGEDSAEISCHGGMYVLNRVLSIIIKTGVRLAEPGEFTRRAFLNGRIDLSQAESVMDIISSENEFSRANSLSQLRGSVRMKVEGLREKIIHETAYIEAALDDPEHYVLDEEKRKNIRTVVEGLCDEISVILKDSESAGFLKTGINTVIVGKPNVGKSSLLNLMLGYERAIVTSKPGTTRDTISERVSLGDISLNITDTAGIRDSSDELEMMGIERTRAEIARADLVLFMMDISSSPDDEDTETASLIGDKTCIVIYNKTDICGSRAIDPPVILKDAPSVMMSVKDRAGTDELKNTIRDLFIKNEIKDSGIYITNKRQTETFRKAEAALERVKDSIDNGMSEDTYTVDLMDAYAYLGEIIGEDISDDLADRIFSEFCMGK